MSTQFIQKNTDVTKPTLNRPNNVFATEGKGLGAVAYQRKYSDINIKSPSLQYHPGIEGVHESNVTDKIETSVYHTCNRSFEKITSPKPTNDTISPLVNTQKKNFQKDETSSKHLSRYPKIHTLSKLKSFHFPRTRSNNTSDNSSASLPSSPPDLLSKSLEMSTRRSTRSSHGNPQHGIDPNQPFDFNQMQKALSETGSEGTHSSNRSSERHRQYTPSASSEQSQAGSRQHSQRQNYHQLQQQQTNEIQVVSSSSAPPMQPLEAVSESNGANNAHKPVTSLSNASKKDKYKGLWGKVGKHGLSQAAAARHSNEGDTAASAAVARAPSKKWDQVLNPMMQKSKEDKKLAKKQNKAEISYHMQQQQFQQANQMPSSTVGGSYVFSETSGTGTVECDCGDDSCPNCNLLLQMSGSGW